MGIGRSARRRDIVINALYAGSRESAAGEMWPDVAQAGGGNFSAIDAAASLAQVATPHDQELLTLNSRLNETYLPYGEGGKAGLANQRVQDNNATRLGVQSCSARGQRLADVQVFQVEPLPVCADLEHSARLGRSVDDGRNIQLHRLALVDEPPGGMPDHRYVLILHGRHGSLRGALFARAA